MRRTPHARSIQDAATLALLITAASALISPAGAQDSQPQIPQALQSTIAGPPVMALTGTPVMAIVSIKDQRISLYDANGGAMRAKVSSGATDHETPVGTYSILQKNKDHYSNVYDSIAMPYMQRLTWSGLALHHGALPGYPASHGCVRLPYEYSQDIFARTRIGMRVIVARDNIAPVEISHPALLQPGPLRNRQVATNVAFETYELDDRSTSVFQADIRNSPGRKAEMDRLKADADSKISDAELAKEPVENLTAESATKARGRAPADKVLTAALKAYRIANDAAARANRDYAAAKDPEKIRSAEREKASADTAVINTTSELASAKVATIAAKVNGQAPAARLLNSASNAHRIADDKAQRANRDLAAVKALIQTADLEKASADKAVNDATLALDRAKAAPIATTDKERNAAERRLNAANMARKIANDKAARATRELTAANDPEKMRLAEFQKSSADIAVINTTSELASAKVVFEKATPDRVLDRTERLEAAADRAKVKAVDRAARAAKALAFTMEPARYTKEEALASKTRAALNAARAAKDKARAALAAIDAELANLDRDLTSATIHRDAAVTEAQAAQRRTYPVSLFVSRKMQRVYLRQGHEAIMDMPVDIANPDQSIGTHVFTAVDYDNDGAALRWTAVSLARRPASDLEKFNNRPNPRLGDVPEPYTTNATVASAVLDRVTLPPEMLEFVSQSAWPGSSLIVSDEEAHKETDTATDFIVLISGEPQGGLVKRPATDKPARAKPGRINVYTASSIPNYGYGSKYSYRYVRPSHPKFGW